jgi:RsmE family RNA methyltransferase
VNLLLVEPADVGADGGVSVSGPRATHLAEVMKVAPGDDVRMGVIDGPVGVGRVLRAGPGVVELIFEKQSEIRPRPRVDLLLALPRPKVMKRLWAQLAAMGVGHILLTNAEKVERNYFDTHVLRESFYRPLLVEGLQQARDTRLPRVSVHRQFRKLIESDLPGLSDASARIVADPSASRSVAEAIRGLEVDRMLLAIGPEGGWNDFELSLLEQRGFVRAGMGPRPLRADTACIALLALAREAISAVGVGKVET